MSVKGNFVYIDNVLTMPVFFYIPDPQTKVVSVCFGSQIFI